MNMTAVNVTALEPAAPVVTEATSMMAVIARAASDPSCDLDKMERLMAMHERMQARQAQAEFAAALASLQADLPSISERGDAAGRYKFALWEDINQAIKPILLRHGFALSFRTDTGNGITVTGVLSHRNGHREETSITLPADPSGNKNAVQAVASSVSYGKRYTAGALLNLTSHGEDDDAFATTSDFDPSEWLAAINGASDTTELDRIAADLKTKTIPAAPLKRIRAAWAARVKAVKA
jgi:hypothetical protein